MNIQKRQTISIIILNFVFFGNFRLENDNDMITARNNGYSRYESPNTNIY